MLKKTKMLEQALPEPVGTHTDLSSSSGASWHRCSKNPASLLHRLCHTAWCPRRPCQLQGLCWSQEILWLCGQCLAEEDVIYQSPPVSDDGKQTMKPLYQKSTHFWHKELTVITASSACQGSILRLTFSFTEDDNDSVSESC
jgi:hypothetical protein